MSLRRLVLELAVIDSGTAALQRGTGMLRDMGQAGAQANRHFAAMGGHLRDGLRGFAAGQEIKRAILDPGIEAAASIQDALAGLQVQLDPGSVAEMERTLAQAQTDAARIAAPTVFSATDVVGIQTGLKKAGLSESDIFGEGGAAEATAKLATAERLSAEQAMDAMVAMGGVFELQGQQFADSADLLARAGGASSTNAAELKEALGQAAIVGSLGVSQEDTLGVLGAMSSTKRGGAAGTSLSAFLRQAAKADEKYDEFDFYNAEGQLKPLVDVATNLREAMAGHTDQEQQLALQKAFGDEGASTALALLKTGDGSLESVLAGMGQARGLDEKVDVLAGTYSGQSRALAGTGKSTLATLFQPALDPLTEGAGKLNTALVKVSEAAEKDPRIAQAATGAAGIGIAAGGAYGLYHLAQAGLSGGRGLGSILGGAGSTAAGVAQGKALEAATGVQPVFVTNWPAGMGAGGLGGNTSLGGGKSAGALGKAGAVGAAGVAGVAMGTFIDQELIGQDTYAEKAVQTVIANVSQVFGAAFMSKEMNQELGRTRRDFLQTTADKVGLNINVTVDKDGSADAAASWDGASEQAVARAAM